MPFPSTTFIFIFFPVVLTTFILLCYKRKSLSPHFLLLASLFYCGVSQLWALPILFFSIIVNYWLVGEIYKTRNNKQRRYFYVMLGLVFNILPLILFKFFDINTFNISDSTFFAVGIPLGLAFYSLQQITALFDIQKDEAIRLSFTRHALWNAMFVQLPAGPIFAYKDASIQYKSLGQLPIKLEMILKGMSLFVFGLFKKIIIAEPIKYTVDHIFLTATETQLNFIEAWCAGWGFILHLYFDFSAYSDMAIGIGLCFGLYLPINFNSPFKSRNVADYISRWHMSLMFFAREYIFLPIFRKVRQLRIGSIMTRQIIAWAIGMLVVYIVIALWHVPSLKMLFYGISVGTFLIVIQVFSIVNVFSFNIDSIWAKKIKKIIQYSFTLLMAIIAGTAFRADNYEIMLNIFSGMINFKSLSFHPAIALDFIPDFLRGYIQMQGFFPNVKINLFYTAPLILFGTFIVFLCPNTMQIFSYIDNKIEQEKWFVWKPSIQWGIFVGFLIALEIMFWNFVLINPFIYEQY